MKSSVITHLYHFISGTLFAHVFPTRVCEQASFPLSQECNCT